MHQETARVVALRTRLDKVELAEFEVVVSGTIPKQVIVSNLALPPIESLIGANSMLASSSSFPSGTRRHRTIYFLGRDGRRSLCFYNFKVWNEMDTVAHYAIIYIWVDSDRLQSDIRSWRSRISV